MKKMSKKEKLQRQKKKLLKEHEKLIKENIYLQELAESFIAEIIILKQENKALNQKKKELEENSYQ